MSDDAGRFAGAFALRRGAAVRLGVALGLSLLGLFAVQLWFHATRTSATFDEPLHLLAGYRHLQCGDYGINAEHPPLLKKLAALPLVGQDLVEPSPPCGERVVHKLEGSVRGGQLITRNGGDGVLVPARLAASILTMLLGVAVFLCAREMFGSVEAFVALTLLSFEPVVLAHGSLVTTDAALAATAFGSVYALYRFARRRSVPRLLVAAGAVGLMLASKHSGVFLVPAVLLLLLTDRWMESGRDDDREPMTKRAAFIELSAFAVIVVSGILILWSFYGFRYRALPNPDADTFSVVERLEASTRPGVAESVPGKIVVLTERLHLLPEAYVFGLADIVAAGDREAYVLGRKYPTGRWFYFPVAFTIKSSIALLLFLPLALLLPGFYRERPRELLFLLSPAILFFAVGMASPLNIGIRHVLPMYPFLIVIASAGVVRLARRHGAFVIIIGVLLLLHVFTTARVAPNYIAFANQFWGGTNNTYRYLDDSNVDWGQNLKIAREYVESEEIAKCWFAYFGNGEIARVDQPCGLMPAFGWAFTERMVDAVPPVIEGAVLLSTSVLPPHEEAFAAFADEEPETTLGGSILVYRGRFEVPVVAALSHTMRSSQFLQQGRVDEAIAEAQLATGLAPRHPRPFLILGIAFAQNGRSEEAREALTTSIALAEERRERFGRELQQAKQVLEMLR